MDMRWKTTACPHDCPCACSMKARVLNGRVEIKPNTDNPWTNFVCAKGLRFRERVFDKRRLTEPLIRFGSGWKPISWHEAWSVWADKIYGAVRRLGPLSLMYLSGAGSMYFSKDLIPHVFSELGGYTATEGSLCSSIGSQGLRESTAGWGVPFVTPEALCGARGVLLWGRNVYATQPQIVKCLDYIRSKGGKTACVDIRKTATSRRCDSFWRIAPGGDWALAAWLCREILARGADSRSWRTRALNADEFLDFTLGLDGAKLLCAAGMESGAAHEILDWLLAHGPVVHMPSFGAQRYMHGDTQFKWIFALAALCGGFDDPCSGLSFSKDEHAIFPESLAPSCKNVRKLPAGAWNTLLPREDPKIEVISICGANPARQCPDSALTARALASVRFKVCCEIFMTDTAELCDLVLPSATFLEEGHDWLGSYWHSFVVRSETVLPPVGGAKSDIEIYDGLARALGLKTSLIGLKDEMDRTLAADRRLEEISDGLYRHREQMYWNDPKAQAVMPASAPETRMPRAGEFRLVTVHANEYINGQSTDAPDTEGVPEICVPRGDARLAGLSERALVKVTSREGGSLVMRVRTDPDIADRTAVAKQGLRGINTLTTARIAPGSGAPYAECFVTIEELSS